MKWAVHDLLEMRNERRPMNSLECTRRKRSQVHKGKDNRGESGGDVQQPQKWREESWDKEKSHEQIKEDQGKK